MTRRRTACVAVAIVVMAVSQAAAQPTAAEIVARSVGAHGGDALTSWQTLKITGTVVMQDGIAYTGAYTLLARRRTGSASSTTPPRTAAARSTSTS